MSSCHPVCTATRCTLLVCVASPGFYCRAINSWGQRHLIVRAGRRCQESSRSRCVSRCAMPQSYPYQMPHACMPCHTYPYCIQGDADAVHIAAASCSCLRRGRREPPSRRRRPLPCPRRLPRCLPRSGCCPQSRHRRLRGHTAVALAASSQSRPCSRRCELRPSELSPSPPPSRARDSPSPPPSLVAHAAASWQRRTFG